MNTDGQTTLTLTCLDDPGAINVESFTILVDWGDRLGQPDTELRFESEEKRGSTRRLPLATNLYNGATPRTFVLTHTYTIRPIRCIPRRTSRSRSRSATMISVLRRRVRKAGDLATNPAGELDGQSNIETVSITNQGIGAEFRIDTTPQVALLTLPERVAEVGGPTMSRNSHHRVEPDRRRRLGAAILARAGEQILELRVINPDGSEGEPVNLLKSPSTRQPAGLVPEAAG